MNGVFATLSIKTKSNSNLPITAFRASLLIIIIEIMMLLERVHVENRRPQHNIGPEGFILYTETMFPL